jgi:hypothetical protein
MREKKFMNQEQSLIQVAQYTVIIAMEELDIEKIDFNVIGV